MNKERVDPLPEPLSKRGQVLPLDDGAGKQVPFRVIDDFLLRAANNDEKRLCIQRLKPDTGPEEIRVGYYTISHGSKRSGSWGWRQNAAMLTQQDFKHMIAEIAKRDWLGV